MNMNKRTWLALLSLVLTGVLFSERAAAQAACSCSGCPSQDLVVTGVFAGRPPGSTAPATINVQQFNPALGQLVSVKYNASVELPSAFSQFENTNIAAACTIQAITFFLNVFVKDPFLNDMYAAGAPFNCSETLNVVLQPFNQPQGETPDYVGNSAITRTCSPPAPAPVLSGLTTICTDTPNALNTFKGTGTVPFRVSNVSTQQQSSDCNNIATNFVSNIRVTVTVTYTYCVGAPPTANDDNATTCVNTPVTLNVLANDCDSDGSINCGSIVITDQPNNGTLSAPAGCAGNSVLNGCPQLNNCPGCGIVYTPNNNFTGADSFSYTVTDATGCTSNVATANLTVKANPNAVNDPGITTCRNTAIDINVLANDTPAAGRILDCSTLTVTVAPAAGAGTTSLVNCAGAGANCGNTCRIKFTPVANFTGTASFTYRITDNNGCSDTATVNVRVCAPTALPDGPISVCQSQCVDINVLANDSVATSCGVLNCASIVIVDPPDHGTAVANGACTGSAPCTGCRVTYCSTDSTFLGVDTFTYNVKDVNGCVSDTVTVSVTVQPSPLLQGRKVVKEIGNDNPITNIPILEGATPGAGCTLVLGSLTVTTQPQFGTVTFNPDGTANYDPDDGAFPGHDTFCFSLINSCGCSASACVEINEPEDCVERNRRNCASLLMFPEYQNTPGRVTLHTITYGCCEDSAPGVWVEMIFIRGDDCTEQNRTIFLTPCDTYSFLTSTQAASGTQGYMYAFAKSGPSPGATPIVSNRLIGNLLVIDGTAVLNYSMNAVAFKGIGPDLSLNDEDNDGVRDLDGVFEYEEAPDRIFIPRFLGQDPGQGGVSSELILIAMSGGTEFSFNGGTEVLFTVYDDNENPYSATYRFFCWTKQRLKSISNVFLQNNLHNPVAPTDDPDEIAGMTQRDAGWFIVDGVRASSQQENIVDPAVYAVLIERVGTFAAAELPFEYCSQVNGDLLPENIFGDPRPSFPSGQDGDNQ